MYHPDHYKRQELELEQRLLERYREGVLSEALSDFFEFGESEEHCSRSELELLEIIGKNVGGEPFGAATDVLADNLSGASYPPHTNRGVTINGSDRSSDKGVTINSSNRLSSLGGYDGGIELGFTGIWKFDEFQRLKILLEQQKDFALSKDTIHHKVVQTFDLNGKTFIMCPKSVVAGASYRYVIEGMGIRIYIHTNPKGDIQPIRVHYLAIGLIGRDFFLKHNEVREFIGSLGFEVAGEKLSRVDMQVMLKVPVTEFIQACHEDRLVTPAQTITIHRTGKSEETLSVGTDLRVVIYDKRKELKKQLKSDPVKVALMLENVLGSDFFEMNTPLTRVEFQLHRRVLKDFGINSVSDLLEQETSLALYCSRKYFRILEEPKKVGHSSTQATSELWLQVQTQFLDVFSGVEGHRQEVKRDKNKIVRCTAEHLHSQLRGCGATAAVLELGTQADFMTVLRFVFKSIGAGAVRLYERYQERAAELASKVFGAGVESVSGCCESVESIRAEWDNWYQKLRGDVQLELEF